MVKNIDGVLWFCCPKCGKKLNIVQPGAECHGVVNKCRGSRCGWVGEMVITGGSTNGKREEDRR